MSAVAALPGVVVDASPRAARAVTLLALREGRRMITRPVYWVIVAGLLMRGGISVFDPGSTALQVRGAIRGLLSGLPIYGALATLFAASLVATSPRRSGAESQFAPAPLDPRLRTLATGLGVLVGPTAVAGLLTLGLAYLEHGLRPPLADAFQAWDYVQLPLLWLGAGLLGVAAASWLPWPGIPLALFVGLIAWTLVSSQQLDHGRGVGYLMPFSISSHDALGLGVSSARGHLGWHAVYLLGLCLLALAVALVRHRSVRDGAVLAFSAASLFVTVSAAWMQLP